LVIYLIGGKIGNVVKGMAWHLKYLEGQSAPGYAVTGCNRCGAAPEGRVGRAGNSTLRKRLGQFSYTTDVIRVMMGNKDGIQLQVMCCQVLKNRLGLAGVYNQGIVICRVGDTPYIVVVKGGDGRNSQHKSPHVLNECG
jgi:hypothetical protein